MTLENYLRERRLTRDKFAAQLGVSRQAVDYWIRGLRFPRPEHVVKIEKITSGLVRAGDWYMAADRGGSK